MDARYRTIYADPPWPEFGGGKIQRGANRHYPLMKVDAIRALPVAALADDNSHLYLWATNNYLPAAFGVMAAWGFRYVTTVTWAKEKIGLGQYFRGMTEHCLFGVRGSLPYRTRGDGKRAQGRTLLSAPATRHSAKPPEMRRMIELVSYEPRIELFAREPHEGWAAWGNQVASDGAAEAILGSAPAAPPPTADTGGEDYYACPRCGYTEEDERANGDHYLCGYTGAGIRRTDSRGDPCDGYSARNDF